MKWSSMIMIQNCEYHDARIGTDQEPYAPQMSGNVLISGCPRSGTKSIGKYYQNRGLLLGHEESGPDGTIDWRHAYNLDLDFSLIMTLIRDPIKTVMSLTELITNSKGDNLTNAYIWRLAKEGKWDDLLTKDRYFSAAIQWWTSVYERRYGLPVIHIDKNPHLPHINSHIRNAPTYSNGIDVDRFFEVAAMYGYTKDSTGAQCTLL